MTADRIMIDAALTALDDAARAALAHDVEITTDAVLAGAELDRAADTNNYGRKVIARWRRTGRLPTTRPPGNRPQPAAQPRPPVSGPHPVPTGHRRPTTSDSVNTP